MKESEAKGKFNSVLYLGLFSVITAINTLGCQERQESAIRVPPTPQGYEVDPDLRIFLQNNPDYQVIFDRIRGANFGVVLFSLEDITDDMWVRFMRVDISPDERGEFDNQVLLAKPNTNGIFPASSCTGVYRIDISADGSGYNNIPVPDLHNRLPGETFQLRPSCVRPIRVILPKTPVV